MIVNNRNEHSSQIAEELEQYYDCAGIYPDERFHCPNNLICPGKDLTRGMQCHLGYKYGDTIKVVVSALDCGNGGADIIEKRTENVIKSHSNIHMKGTLNAVSLIIGKTPEDSVYYMAMINACKCCHRNSSCHLPKRYYENCAIHKIHEYKILTPDIILFQGKDILSLAGCKNNIYEIEDSELDSSLKKYLKRYSDNTIDCYAVICIHPSARGRHIYKVKEFYNELFPKIAEYLRNKLNREH